MTGSAGANVIVTTALNDTINSGGGNDYISAGGGADSITTGTGNDTVRIISRADTQGAGYAAGNTTAANIDGVTDFTGNGAAAGDRFELGVGANAFGTALTFATDTTAQVTVVNNITAATIGDIFTNTNAAVAGTGSTTGAGGVAQIYDVTVTTGALAGHYIIINDQTAAIAQATDTIINITGVAAATDASDYVFSAFRG